MKPPSVSVLLGVAVLLLIGLLVLTGISYLPPFPLTGLHFHLMIFLPYFFSTILLLTITDGAEPGNPVIVTMEISEEIRGHQEPAEDYDDVDSCVITLHRF
ncbi:hypothetical protein ILYODFUR_032941 [Ilyodon furcidens]|uniref:Uncharacterized protein n=1 Tax=Ilyodon furcidens TaxID=33524 RepID=A0ABV0U1F9_9TELE